MRLLFLGAFALIAWGIAQPAFAQCYAVGAQVCSCSTNDNTCCRKIGGGLGGYITVPITIDCYHKVTQQWCGQENWTAKKYTCLFGDQVCVPLLNCQPCMAYTHWYYDFNHVSGSCNGDCEPASRPQDINLMLFPVDICMETKEEGETEHA